MLSSFVWSDILIRGDGKGNKDDEVADDGEEVIAGSAPTTYSLAGLKGRARKDKAREVGVVALPRFEHVST